MNKFFKIICGLVMALGAVMSGKEYYRENPTMFDMPKKDCIMGPQDMGLVNGHVTVRGWQEDVARVHGLVAPPYYSGNFNVELKFNGAQVPADDYLWKPEALKRMGAVDGLRYTSWLVPLAESRAVMLKMEIANESGKDADLDVEMEVTGGLGKSRDWGFDCPSGEVVPESASCDGKSYLMTAGECCGGVACSLPLEQLQNGRMKLPRQTVTAGETVSFHISMALGAPDEVRQLLAQSMAAPETAIDEAYADWTRRVEELFTAFPVFESDNAALVRLYNRSLLHFLLNEWRVKEYMFQPYYGTGGVNGGCTCCYLWNYGEPFKMWGFLSPDAFKNTIRAYLHLDLTKCYAFYPDDGKPTGPYYPVNQEKMIFLIHSYVMQTKDVDFLRETVDGKTIIEHVVAQALLHDDLSRPAVLVDYGGSNAHLELRGKLKYTGILPDMNLRRCVYMRLAGQLCRLCGHDPKVDFDLRAKALKTLIRERLYDSQAGWFKAVETRGQEYRCYTMQMFKAIGWNNWAMDKDIEEQLVRHIMNPTEFLGGYGLHSLSKTDPAYDESDIDNGGPGACISFTPAVIDRLYMAGYQAEGDELLNRLLWLADCLPYWGDSHRADRREYRHDTPLQNDIQGGCLAQTIIFGLFGIRINPDFTVDFTPHLPKQTGYIALKGLKLCGKSYDVVHKEDTCDIVAK